MRKRRYEGELLAAPPEGELRWVTIEDALELPMQPWFRKRFPLFFEKGTFEIHDVSDQEKQITIAESVKKL
ncbi:hypothetical protein [Paenibacillus cineris]|uniref:hypothetical protein n=1 Tax=Paenibacillus cineris TaxID=237530 RepID=UPI001B016463|nr:hypothetical protein [Paenibacillus cineris]GIO60987.1 hypothetical protein J43TS9_25610 [Paenibacillus cineris]